LIATVGRQLLALLGLGAQVGVLLPYSRAQEREADILGLTYMARAGFDPQQSIALWENMAKAGGPRPPAFLSTHPSHGRRIAELREQMPKAMALYREARAQGKIPRCEERD
jgi:predicted Zn-dependent protease